MKAFTALKDEIGKREISVIVPTFNEADSIGFVLQDLEKLSQILPNTEIVVVDCSSIDGTKEIVEECQRRILNVKLYSTQYMGYSAALLEGIERAKGDIIVTFDGDGAYDAKDIARLIQPLMKGQADLVLGSRLWHEVRPGSVSFADQFGSKVMSLLSRILFGFPIIDSMTNLRALRKSISEKLNLQAHDYAINVELVSIALAHGLTIAEVPVAYRPRSVTYSRRARLRFRDGFHILFAIIRGAIRHG